MNKKHIIIIELLIVVIILIAGIAITLNLNNQTTPVANNTRSISRHSNRGKSRTTIFSKI